MPVIKMMPLPPCRDCGEPATVTKMINGQPVNLCVECLTGNPSKKEQDTQLLRKLGLIK